MEDVFRYLYGYVRQREGHQFGQGRLPSIRVAKVFVDEISQVLLDLFLSSPLGGYVEDGGGSNEPLALLRNEDWNRNLKRHANRSHAACL